MREAERWMTVPQAAKYAGVSVDRIRKAYYSGDLRVSSLGSGPKSQKRFLPEWIDEWLTSRATGGPGCEPGERAAS